MINNYCIISSILVLIEPDVMGGGFCKELLSENTLRLFYSLSVVMTMVPTLLRQFRRALQIKKSITNAPGVL